MQHFSKNSRETLQRLKQYAAFVEIPESSLKHYIDSTVLRYPKYFDAHKWQTVVSDASIHFQVFQTLTNLFVRQIEMQPRRS